MKEFVGKNNRKHFKLIFSTLGDESRVGICEGLCGVATTLLATRRTAKV